MKWILMPAFLFMLWRGLAVSSVEMSVFKLSRLSRLLRCQFLSCQDRDSRPRLCWKSRLQGIKTVKRLGFELLRLTKLSICRFLDCQDLLNSWHVSFETFLTIDLSVFKLSRLRLLIETMSRQIEAPTQA
jgi:DNA-binding Xre family transcriptional regulator